MRKKNSFSDQEIIEAIQQNKNIDPYILYLYEINFDSVLTFVRKNKGTQQDAEDVFQDTMMAVIKAIREKGYRGEASLKTFIYSISKNLWSNKVRKQDKELLRDTKFYIKSVQIEPPVNILIEEVETQNQLYMILDQLGEVCKKILIYFYYENLSIRTILEKLDYQEYKNEQTVRNKKSKCMKHLSELIGSNMRLKNHLKKLLKGTPL